MMQIVLKKFIKKCLNEYFLNDINTLRMSNPSLGQLVIALKTNSKLFRSKLATNFLLSLYNYAIELESNLPYFETTNKKIYIMHVCVWGESYSEKLLSYLIPSLLSKHNIPAISHNYNIKFCIVCDKTTNNKCKSSDIMKLFNQYVDIIYNVIPDDIFINLKKSETSLVEKTICFILKRTPTWKYQLLGCLQNVATKLAKNNSAYISYLMPDMLLSDSAITNMFNAIDNEKTAVAVTAFRSSFFKVKKEVKKYRTDLVLCIPSLALPEIAVETMHISAQNRIISTKNKSINITPQFIYSYSTQVVIRAFHYHPMLINFAKVTCEINFDYLPIDNTLFYELIDQNHPLEDQIFVNEDASYIGVMELSDDDIEATKIVARNLDIKLAVSKYFNINNWNKINLFLFSKRCIYNTNRENENMISDIPEIVI